MVCVATVFGVGGGLSDGINKDATRTSTTSNDLAYFNEMIVSKEKFLLYFILFKYGYST